MSSQDDGWTDWDTGPVARPFTLTSGRTRPEQARSFDLVDMVACTAWAADIRSSSPERTQILGLCQRPIAVAELAAAVELPLGVVRVLLDDFAREGLIEVRAAAPKGVVTDKQLLRRVLEGLRAL
jgi:hypothetical protein